MSIPYHCTLCNITEERKPDLLRGGSLKSRMEVLVLLECYAARFGRWLPKFRQSLSISFLKAKMDLILEAELES